MQIITLTTDMGLTDHYVASMKGTVLKALNDIRLIDITHHVQAFDVAQAAYYLSSCFYDFPEGTIHIIGVDSEPVINFGSSRHSRVPAVLCFKGHYFVSNDNGVFGLLVREETFESIWHIDDLNTIGNAIKFPAKNILVPIAIKIAQGQKLKDFATQVESFNRLIAMNPILEPNVIKGNVIHIDHFGNIITNIDKDLFDRMGKDVPFTIFFRRKEYYIDEISATYNEVPPGEKLALFNTNNLLEIAINRGAKARNGGASSLFGLGINDTIRIEFSPAGSKETLDSLFE